MCKNKCSTIKNDILIKNFIVLLPSIKCHENRSLQLIKIIKYEEKLSSFNKCLMRHRHFFYFKKNFFFQSLKNKFEMYIQWTVINFSPHLLKSLCTFWIIKKNWRMNSFLALFVDWNWTHVKLVRINFCVYFPCVTFDDSCELFSIF